MGTTQTAERAYRAIGAPGRVETRLRVGQGACLHWVPQELILSEGAALERRLDVDMAGDAELVMLEALVLGREAMGCTICACGIGGSCVGVAGWRWYRPLR